MATYKHDALGRRVEKDLGTSRERYVYSGFETVSVYDSSDTWARDFVFGDGIDEPLMLRQADVTDFDGDQDTSEVTRHFYHRNALGSVLLLTDMNEAEGVSYRYDPYGAVTITVGGTPQSSDPLGNPWMFTSRFQDEETGLTYYRARQYAPGVGRFLQRDPLEHAGGDNLYEYGAGRPTSLSDPLGLAPLDPQSEGPPDLATHVSTPPAAAPNSRLPDPFITQAHLDQWLNSAWLDGSAGPTWLIRLRDHPTFRWVGGFANLRILEVVGPIKSETPRQRVRVNDSLICDRWTSIKTWYVKIGLVVGLVGRLTYTDRGSLRNRQQHVYDEWLRGHRAPKRHEVRWANVLWLKLEDRTPQEKCYTVTPRADPCEREEPDDRGRGPVVTPRGGPPIDNRIHSL